MAGVLLKAIESTAQKYICHSVILGIVGFFPKCLWVCSSKDINWISNFLRLTFQRFLDPVSVFGPYSFKFWHVFILSPFQEGETTSSYITVWLCDLKILMLRWWLVNQLSLFSVRGKKCRLTDDENVFCYSPSLHIHNLDELAVHPTCFDHLLVNAYQFIL